jgi:hypothetical protein
MGYRKSQHHREHHPSNMLEIQPVEGDEKENIDQRKQAPTCGLKEEIPGICFLHCLHQMELLSNLIRILQTRQALVPKDIFDGGRIKGGYCRNKRRNLLFPL